MPPRINRAGISLEQGEALREIARRLASLDEYTGEARQRELRAIQLQLKPISQRLQVVINNCRAAGGSYPNYPAVRKAIQEGGEKVYEIQQELEAITTTFTHQMHETPELDFAGFIPGFAKLGQALKLIPFAPPLPEDVQV